MFVSSTRPFMWIPPFRGSAVRPGFLHTGAWRFRCAWTYSRRVRLPAAAKRNIRPRFFTMPTFPFPACASVSAEVYRPGFQLALRRTAVHRSGKPCGNPLPPIFPGWISSAHSLMASILSLSAVVNSTACAFLLQILRNYRSF